MAVIASGRSQKFHQEVWAISSARNASDLTQAASGFRFALIKRLCPRRILLEPFDGAHVHLVKGWIDVGDMQRRPRDPKSQRQLQPAAIA
jgi:hypothetical protein